MEISKRAQEISESITLKLNAKAQSLAAEGRKIYNLTAGQLPFNPDQKFVEAIESQTKFLKSYQYSPVAGELELRKKVFETIQKKRSIDLGSFGEKFSCLIGNGGKGVISEIIGCFVNPGDEVVLLAPFWISYPEMVKIYGGTTKVVGSSLIQDYAPSLDELKATLTQSTKLLILNSPNNPAGVHYSQEWMQGLASLLKDYPNLTILSDEIYFDLCYYDPVPTYFYQYDSELLNRTIIVDGISKTFAATGLRVGYVVAPNDLISALNRFQGQVCSGANSLIQKALLQFDWDRIDPFLLPIKDHLRTNALALHEVLKKYSLDKVWYQPRSAFYFLMDFSSTPAFERFRQTNDTSVAICEDVLEKLGIAMVPGSSFGVDNTARISLVSPKEIFHEAMDKLGKYLTT